MKIFITGGTGFIGTHLVKKLREEGNDLLLLSEKSLEGINFVEGDLAEINKWKDKVKKFQPEAGIHLAWEGLPDYSVDINRKNINYGLDLFSFLTNIGCKTILSVGSAWEYRGRFPEKAVEGAMFFKPTDTFSAAKWIVNLWGTAVVEEKNRENNLGEKFIWARIFFVYGPGQRETSLIPYLINCWKKVEAPEIKNPLAQNDFIYIDDVIEAIVLLLKKCQKSGEYDIGQGRLISNQEVINIIAKKLNVMDWYKEINLPKEAISFFPCANISKLKEMGWQPRINLEQGIQKMIDYYLSKN